MTRHRTSASLALPVAMAALLALSSCSSASQAAEADPTTSATPDTISISGLPGATAPVNAAPTTPLATEPATTDAPDTTEPATTEPPTTAAPTTTVAPNVEVVGKAVEPLAAVGTTSGPATSAVQERLLALGFWHAGVDGDYGHTTSQAVMAFQKYLGLRADGKVDQVTADWLTGFPERARGTSNSGTLVEIDKAKQLLFIILDGRTLWTFNTSTGSEQPYETVNKKDPTKIEKGDSVTPNGLWKINRERPEGWWEGDLGEIYRPKYFKGGIAIHGMTSIPNYPASHGCVRVSVPAMDFIWETGLVPMRTTIWVHG